MANLLIHTSSRTVLCEVTAVDALAVSNLATAASSSGQAGGGGGRQEGRQARAGGGHCASCASALCCRDNGRAERVGPAAHSTHTQLGRQPQHVADADVGKHLVDAVAIAVQRCMGMALQKSQLVEGAGGDDRGSGGVSEG